jgi:RNA polymerase sigma-70 factor, ECF subfamily
MNKRTELLSQQLVAGDPSVLGELLQQVRDRLLRIIEFRMDRRLRGRLDPEDIFQELSLVATRRLEEYQHSNDPMPGFVWLRFLAIQKTIELNRVHIGVAARSLEREVSLNQSPAIANTSAELASHLLGREPTPSQVTQRIELADLLGAALKRLDPTDREILELRHFEQLSNEEAARVLEINSSAASSRYVRAIKRLKAEMLKSIDQST